MNQEANNSNEINPPIVYSSEQVLAPETLKSIEKSMKRKNNIFMAGVVAAVLVGYGALAAAVVSSDNTQSSNATQASSSQQEGMKDSIDLITLPNFDSTEKNPDSIFKEPSVDIDLANINLPKGVERADGGYLFGDPNANIKVEVWADFQCPYCASFDADAADPLFFAEDNGAIRNEYYYAAFLAEGSVRSANALGCAADQDKFREFKKAASEYQTNQPSEFTNEILNKIGEEIGIENQNKYEKCVAEGTYNDYALLISQLMPERGVGGTPTVLIDGENVFQNGISFDEFLSRIGLNVVNEEQ